ncbi:MAG: quinolinate synthase NadA [Candidatus Aenigmatarchaeota archaeon]|nr:MAG: quinolinate synthase NadA [Candidatus Aenigmarchaeota archaeon]
MANDIVREIEVLKEKRKAVILAHNYQPGEVQDIADFYGDSLELSRKAADTDADVIVFCGVDFMAETAKIMSPQKTVLIPEKEAECPMAAMITAEQLRKLKAEHPGVPVLSYVNTSAEVKAESDICCTSANLLKIANSIDSDEIIVTPDKHLANYLQTRVKKRIIPWNGYCPTHAKILPQHVMEQKKRHPEAKVLVHPECRLDVIELADEVTSTSGMVRYAKISEAKEFIVATEVGMLYRLKKDNPGKEFYPATELALCPNMKKINLHSVLISLRDMKHKVVLPEDIRKKARKAIERMLEIS